MIQTNEDLEMLRGLTDAALELEQKVDLGERIRIKEHWYGHSIDYSRLVLVPQGLTEVVGHLRRRFFLKDRLHVSSYSVQTQPEKILSKYNLNKECLKVM